MPLVPKKNHILSTICWKLDQLPLIKEKATATSKVNFSSSCFSAKISSVALCGNAGRESLFDNSSATFWEVNL